MISNWLKDIRNANGDTQEAAAEKAGINRSFYSMIELGIRRPTPEVAMKIAGALGFDWTRFYTEEMKPDQRSEDEKALETSKA
jgi:putative transcriptional regulator